MHLEIFMLWLIIWVIFLIMSIIEQRGIVFGFLAGFWILILGIFVYTNGVQYKTGVNLTEVSGGCNLVYSYTNMVTPYSNVGMLWALPFILLGMYITWLATTRFRANWRNRK